MIYPWQQDIWKQLLQSRQQQRLHHALLLIGQAGTGKSAFAFELAHALLCKAPDDTAGACGKCDACQLIAASTHPDLTSIKPLPPRDSKAADPVLSIKIDVIRQLSEKLATTAQLSGKRIAIIDGADRMGHNAANSLLKTLEEPGNDTHLILVSSRPHRLPVTIRSRCQQIVFPVPPADQAANWLQQQGINKPEILLARHHGSPLAAFTAADQEDADVLSSALTARVSSQTSLQYSDALAKQPRSATLMQFIDWLSDVAKLKSGLHSRVVHQEHIKQLDTIARQADWKRIYRLQDELARLARYDSIALNNQLFWENLLISWDRL